MMKINQKIFNFNSKNPLPIDECIEKVLYDQKSGYYTNKDPFGENGDFITSPTISNLFSEIITIWLISTWEKMSKPKKEPVTYSEEALKYFQEMNDQAEFTTEPVSGDYVDYLLGDVGNNSYEGTDMEVEWEDLEDDSDWFMD